jgi:hypothetical protein
MRRVHVLALITAIFAVAVPVALANANFHYANASVDKSTGDLAVSFKLSGLGNTITSADVQLTAGGTAEYSCINNGGHHPSATNKETVNGPVSGGGSFPVRNGSVTGTITASPVDAGNFSCPGGQTMYLTAVSYSGMTVSSDAAGGASTAASPDTISLTGLLIPVG